MVSPIIHRHSVEMDSCEEDIYTVKTNKLIIDKICTTIVVSLAKRSVSFTSEIFVKETIGLEEYTQDEIHSSWYSENEIRQISKCCLDILSDQNSRLLLLHEEEEGDETKKYMRGLEPHTVLGSISRRKNRHTAISLVLTEQLKQRRGEREVMAVNIIADIYSNATSSSQLWARVTAIQDHREAEAYLDEEEDDNDFLESRKRKQQQQPNKTSNFHSDVQSTGRLVAMHKVLPRAA